MNQERAMTAVDRIPLEEVVKVPRGFIRDCAKRGLHTPVIVHEQHAGGSAKGFGWYWIRRDDVALRPLMAEARRLSDGVIAAGSVGRSAHYFLEALSRQGENE